MKNLQLTKLGFLLFLILLCGCSDHFVIDTPAGRVTLTSPMSMS